METFQTVSFDTPFSSFSIHDIDAARSFYVDILGLTVEDLDTGMLRIDLGEGHGVLVYPKGEGHSPASFTVLNLPVADISAKVQELTDKGVTFELYEGMGQDDDGVLRGRGPAIAWFTDPSGNVFSIIER